jgi:hypothetical protein
MRSSRYRIERTSDGPNERWEDQRSVGRPEKRMCVKVENVVAEIVRNAGMHMHGARARAIQKAL